MTDIINIDDHRPTTSSGPVVITFYGHPYRDENGESQNMTLNVRVENGDFEGIINEMRENGGRYLEGKREGEFWFFPWPCAAVRIRAA